MRFVVRSLVVLVLLLGVARASLAQDSAYARSIIRQLSSHAFYGRGCNHHGDSLAAEFLRGQFKTLGVEPLAADYWQRYPLEAYLVDSNCSVRVNGRTLQPYVHYRIVRGYNDKMMATAFLLAANDSMPVVRVNRFSTQTPITPPRSPHQFLATVEIVDTAIIDEVRSLDVDIPIRHVNPYMSQNVCGFVRGETDTMVVFSAHYDHLGTTAGGIYFPGAHDNASGVAAVLDLARMAVSEHPHYTQVFYLFSGEEHRLNGSEYAFHHPLLDFSKVRLWVNIDMFCGGTEGFMVENANDSTTSPFVHAIDAANQLLATPVAVHRRDNAPNSDHYWFSAVCPAIFIYTMGEPHGIYHDPSDTCDRCGLAYYNDILRLIRTVLAQ